MNRSNWIVAVAAVTVLLALQAPRMLPAQPMANANYEYRVLPQDRLVGDAEAGPAAYEASLNRMAEDDWELVTVSNANHWVFRRPIVN